MVGLTGSEKADLMADLKDLRLVDHLAARKDIYWVARWADVKVLHLGDLTAPQRADQKVGGMAPEGTEEGSLEGCPEGQQEGSPDGAVLGSPDGCPVGSPDGPAEG